MDFEKAYSFLIEKLENELPKYLHYHNPEHTKDVLAAAIRLAKQENIFGDDLAILKTSALFHDAGFIETYTDQEENSSKIARAWLPQFK
jgi:HD superfamily phosphodiesterase